MSPPQCCLPAARQVLLAALVTSGLALASLHGAPLPPDARTWLPFAGPAVDALDEADRLFGTLRTVQVVIGGADVIEADFLARLQRLTERLGNLAGIGHVLSLTNVADVSADGADGADGTTARHLVEALPHTVAERDALRRHVLGRSHIVGNLVAADSGAVQVICTLLPGADQGALTARIEALTAQQFDAFGMQGAPAVAQSVRRSAAGMRPLAVALAAALGAALCGRTRAAAATLLLACGGAAALGMALRIRCGAPSLTLVLLPCIWLFVGSALGLGRWLMPPARTWRHAMAQGRLTGVAGIAAAAVVLAPACRGSAAEVRDAVWAALGILLQAGAALVVVPAGRALAATAPAARTAAAAAALGGPPRRLAAAALLLLVLAAASALQALPCGSGLAAVLGRDGRVVAAQALLRQHFDTEAMVQVQLDGDFAQPLALRHLEQLADRLRAEPGVSGVAVATTALRQAALALTGAPRLPPEAAQVRGLLAFTGDEPALASLLTGDAQHALLHVRLRPPLAPATLAALQAVVAEAGGRWQPVQTTAVAGRRAAAQRLQLQLGAAAAERGLTLPAAVTAGAADLLLLPPAVRDAAVAGRLVRSLTDPLSAAPQPDDARTAALAAAAVALGPAPAAAPLAALADGAPDRDPILAAALEEGLAGAWEGAAIEARLQRVQAATLLPRSLTGALRTAAAEAQQGRALVRDEAHGGMRFAAKLSGQPVLEAALTGWALRSFWHGCACATLACVAVLAAQARSLRLGLQRALCCAGAPTLVFGLSAALRLPVDALSLTLVAGLLALGCCYVLLDCRRLVAVHGALWSLPALACLLVDLTPLRHLTCTLAASALAAALLARLLTPLQASWSPRGA